MTELIEGIDISKYQGSVDQATWRALKKSGQEVAVVGSWHGRDGNPHCEENLLRAAAQGMKIATYTVLNGSQPGNAAVSQGKSFCGNVWSDLRFVAIDCELDGITETHIRQAEAAIIAEGQTPIIYTAYWWWHDHFGNPNSFSHLPLWNAYYDQQPDIDFQKLPYGGWQDVVIEQYAGSVQLEGVTVDRNSFRKEFIYPKKEEDDMPQLWRLKKEHEQTTFITDGLLKAHVKDKKALKELQDAGVWPKEIKVVSKEALDQIPTI